MPFSVAVLDEVSNGNLPPERATTLVAAAFAARGLDLNRLGEVSVVLVPLDVIQQLNLKYRDIDSPTDVLSFEIDGPYGEMFGEVVISPEYVGFDRACVEELVIHGALHLAGMDHGDDFDRSEMATAQRDVLGGVGVGEG
jgi:probable rRNA maturation factor